MELKPRESVIFAEDFERMVAWYQEALGFRVTDLFDQDYHYANLSNDAGIQLGIAPVAEVENNPQDRSNNSVVLQFEVADVPAFLEHIKNSGGSVSFGPALDKVNNFWFGGFADIEGNPFWVVDENCP